MRHVLAAALAALAVLPAHKPANAAKVGFYTRDSVLEWMDGYRKRPEPARLPEAVRTLAKSGAFKDPEAAGYHVGFIAGVLGANPQRADALVAKMLPLAAGEQWVVVRAIAYSGLPEWRAVLRYAAPRLPARQEMIEQYLTGKLPTLDAIALDKSPTLLEKLRGGFGARPETFDLSFGNNPELLDTLWGVYFATGDYRPVWRILTMLPWSKERDSVDRLTVGSMAKVTLANNASRYPDLLAMLKEMSTYQEGDTAKILAEVIRAAENMEGPRLRKQALLAIDDLKRRGPGFRRDVALWGQVGQGAIALGCVAAAVASLTTLGLPCVIGGAVATAALNYYAAQ
jgi:hypothetical protein